MKLRLRTVSLWLVVLVAALALGALLVRHRGERALERKLAELRAQGEKLTVRELFGAPTAEDAQHHARFNAVLGQLAGVPSWASSMNQMTFLQPGLARVLWSQETGVPDGAKSNSFLATWDAAAQDIEGIQEALDQLRRELADPPRSTGHDYDSDPITSVRPDFVALRKAAQWLAGAVTWSLHAGDTFGAQTNLAALLNLSQAYRDEPTFVSHMIRVAISGLATTSLWDALQGKVWMEPQLAELQADLQRADATADAARGIVGDRAHGLAYGRAMYQARSPWFAGRVQDIFWDEVRSSGDLCAYLDEMKPFIDSARDFRNGAPWAEVESGFKGRGEPSTALEKLWRTYLTPFSDAAIPRTDLGLRSIARNETLRQMTLAAIAIRRYELRHGQPPPSLEVLVPALLAKLPHDSFSGQPLHYRRTEDGSFLLYSVGADGKDDGGDTTPNTKSKSWTIWDSPDAVWPKPLEE